MPKIIDHHKGLHIVAIYEAAKGLLVLVVGFGFLNFLDDSVQEMAAEILQTMHLNPANRYPQIFLNYLERFDGIDLVWLAVGAFVYSFIRLLEAYGLWRQKVWAEWLAILSGGIYIPVEIYEMRHGITPVKVLITLGNCALVIYLIWVRYTMKNKSKLS